MSKVDSYSILLIDDELEYRRNFAKILQKGIERKFEFASTGSAREGLEIIQKNNQQGKKTLAFIDIILPDLNGDELVKQIELNNTNAQGILISAHKTKHELEQIRSQNKWLVESLEKPIDNRTIKSLVNSYLPEDSSRKNIVSAVNFDYDSLDRSLANYLKQEASEIKTILKRTVENTIEIGRRLTQIKKTLPHGDFYPWIEQELGLHSTTVLHFMRVWETFGARKEQIVQSGLNVSILYVLSAPSTPDELRLRVLALAQKGESVSITQVKQLKKEYEQRKSDSEKNHTIEVIGTPPTSSGAGVTRRRNKFAPRPMSSDDPNSRVKTSELHDLPEKEQKIHTSSPTVSAQSEENLAQDRSKSQNQNPKQQIVGVIRQKNPASEERFYNLGQHLLYNGFPQSPDFLACLPSNLSLCLGFPTQPDWTKSSLVPVDSQTTIIHDSELRDDLDIFVLAKSIEKSIETYTNGDETILFSFLPYPELLLIADLLQCRCFIAEPNFQLCQQIISIWNNKTERVKTIFK